MTQTTDTRPLDTRKLDIRPPDIESPDIESPENGLPSIRPGLRPSAARAAAAARLVGGSRVGATGNASGPAAGDASGPAAGDASGPAAGDASGHPPGDAPGFGHAAGAAFGHLAAGAAALAVPWFRSAPGETPERRRHLEVVEPRPLTAAQRRRRARVLLIAGVGTVTAIALLLVYMHVVLAQRQFRLDRVNTMVQQEQANYQDLRLQVAQLDSPAHIISTAVGQLGMIQPVKVTYLTPQPGSDPPSGPHLAAPTGSLAPGGDADWPAIKSQLAGTP